MNKEIKMSTGKAVAVLPGKRRGRPAGHSVPERVRTQIKTALLVTRLHKIACGEVKAEPHQVTAAVALLRKVLPDLQATLITGDQNVALTIITRAE
jgi:hypothetical protein